MGINSELSQIILFYIRECRDDMTFLVPNCRDPSGYPPILSVRSTFQNRPTPFTEKTHFFTSFSWFQEDFQKKSNNFQTKVENFSRKIFKKKKFQEKKNFQEKIEKKSRKR